MSATRQLSTAQARRIALAAQGLADGLPATPTTRHLRRVIDQVAVVQIDSVNVLTRSHYLPFFSRLGPYDVSLLDRARDRGPRRLVEYWAHEASLITPRTWPLLHFRMRRAHELAWGGMRRVARDHPEIVEAVREEVQRSGPATSRQVESALAHERTLDARDWGWNWSLVKAALEHLFWAGEISSAGRTPQFERRYAPLDLVLPARTAPPPDDVAFVELIRIAARAHGVGTEQCLRDYFRLRPEQARPAIRSLVSAGELEPVTIGGWHRPAYLHSAARIPRRAHTEALLSPFDSLVWQRDRTLALWDFRFRLEIYLPRAQRVHGYYVLPFLFGEHLVGRVDLKADRPGGRLVVHAVHWEPGASPDARPALGRQLAQLAGWLGLNGPV
ncbi:MAG TPA: crosslink repair DNA glycosylase YcaQ family protein [Dermatophilaceae bacterium]|nr:crosslink repair DNA glycosylase YcaQ family protein [Dermatophilaceae bacterium]